LLVDVLIVDLQEKTRKRIDKQFAKTNSSLLLNEEKECCFLQLEVRIFELKNQKIIPSKFK